MDGPAEAHDARAVCDDAILTPPQHRGLAARLRTCVPRRRFERPAPQQTDNRAASSNVATSTTGPPVGSITRVSAKRLPHDVQARLIGATKIVELPQGSRIFAPGPAS